MLKHSSRTRVSGFTELSALRGRTSASPPSGPERHHYWLCHPRAALTDSRRRCRSSVTPRESVPNTFRQEVTAAFVCESCALPAASCSVCRLPERFWILNLANVNRQTSHSAQCWRHRGCMCELLSPWKLHWGSCCHLCGVCLSVTVFVDVHVWQLT